MKRIIIVHRWDGSPKKDWLPWIKKELQIKRFVVIIPKMPHPEKPDIRRWVNKLKAVVDKSDKNTYFVGHSIGCQTILRYLEKVPVNQKIGGAVFVAGWLKLKNLESPEEKSVASPWLRKPINLKRVRRVISAAVAIFSDNDPHVPLNNKNIFKKLGAKIFMEHRKGHFTGDEGVKKLPAVLRAITTITK